MKHLFLLFSFGFCSTLHAQEVDTLAVKRILQLEATIDSLRQSLRLMDSELQRVKATMAEGTDLDQLIAALTGEADEDVPEEQRSRRKRVDALLRAITNRPGQLRFNGGATTILQGTLDRDPSFVSGAGSIDLFALTSFGTGTLLFFDFEAIGGNGPNARLETLTALNGDAGSTQDQDGLDRLNVREAWAEFSLLVDAVTLTAGKIDLTNYFDNNAVANDETSQFIGAGFVNSAALAVPGPSPGLRMRTTVLQRLFLQLGVVSTDNSGDDLFAQLFTMGSGGFKVFPNTDWEGNVRLYAYHHPTAEGGWGYGFSMDQSVAGFFRAFVRRTLNESSLGQTFGLTSAWSTGFHFFDTLGGREVVLGAAYGEARPSDPTLEPEQTFETYARYQVNRWTYVSPHLQWVGRPGGSAGRLWLAGLRTQFNF